MPRPNLPIRNTLGAPELEAHELKPDEKMARITVTVNGAAIKCLVPGCDFELSVPQAPRSVMEHELKDFYRDHCRHRHIEYFGRTLFEFVLGDDVPRTTADEVPF